MRKIENFKFYTNVSVDRYKNKEEASACLTSQGAKTLGMKKMSFEEQKVTTDEFLDYATDGFAFCGLFRFNEDEKIPYTYFNRYTGKECTSYVSPYYKVNKSLKLTAKKDEYWTGTQCVFIDIDDTKFEFVNDYVDCLTYTPTIVYPSYSDGIEKKGKVSRRFHMVYVFDSILNKTEFDIASKALTDQLIEDTNEPLDDDCGSKISQYMNGCYKAAETYNTHYIYNIDELYCDVIDTTLNHKLEKRTEEPTQDEKDNDLINKLLRDWDRLSEEEFKNTYNWVWCMKNMHNVYRMEKEDWLKDSYQFVDDEYFRLFYNSNTLFDGQKRRKNLYQRMCLRRILKPSITKLELIYNTLLDIIRYFNNDDRVLNAEFIIKNIDSALKFTLEDIKEKYKGEISYLQSLTRPKRGIIYKNRTKHTTENTYNIIDEYYNHSLSVAQNIEAMKNDGFIIGKTTIYNYLKVRGYAAVKVTDEELMAQIDLTLTPRKNYTILHDSGIKASKKRVYELYEKKKEYVEQVQEKTNNEIEWVVVVPSVKIAPTITNNWSKEIFIEKSGKNIPFLTV